MVLRQQARSIALALVLLGLVLTGTPGAAAGTPQACSELIKNGGFETGAQNWEQYSAGGVALVSDYFPHTGAQGAYLAGLNNADDRIGQRITLPAGNVAILTAWWAAESRETANVYDRMVLRVLRPDGSLLGELAAINNSAPQGIWDEVVFNITSYAGQTVQVQFAAITDGTNITDFYVDDVSVLACTANWRHTYLPRMQK